MRLLRRFFPESTRAELPRLLAMMGLFFLVVCAVGILRPVKNALALDGLGATDYYKTYLVSAVVILFVPVYNRLSDIVPWRWLIPTVAFTFAVELVLFRLFYVDGSTLFGLLFYGWYDLFAAALVTQFFMATQLFFNARSAKQAYPLVIAGGSIGATLGGAITGFFSERVGTPNLLLVAAALIAVFSFALPMVWGPAPPGRVRKEPHKLDAGEFRTLLKNRHVRLIAISVLLTVLVKQLVDYQFNTMSKEVFVSRDAISAFQGKFNAVTQWLPIVALMLLQPALKRWGVGFAVMVLPVAMMLTNLGLEIWWGLGAMVVAKGAETSLRYSTERASREILYVPVPEAIKLKAKAYIDVAVEKGIGKVASAGLIALALLVMPVRQITLVGIALSAFWLVMTLAMRREYVRTLASSIEGRFASLRGGFASIADPNIRAAIQRALRAPEPGQVAFALDLIGQGAPRDFGALAPDLNALLDHPSEKIRQRALQLLVHTADDADRQRVDRCLTDAAAEVREAAVEVMCARGDAESTVGILLQSDDPRVRTAALSAVVRGAVPESAAHLITRDYIDQHLPAARAGDAAARREVAVAAGALPDDAEVTSLLTELIEDSDAVVACAALESAGRLGTHDLYPGMVRALARPATRKAARDALTLQGAAVADRLVATLLNTHAPARLRRQIPTVLAHIPAKRTVNALLESYLSPETDQLLDYRSLKALSKLRAQDEGLVFESDAVISAIQREVDAISRYEQAAAAVESETKASPAHALLLRALEEARIERRESIFRLIGLLYPPDAVRDCYHRITGGETVSRANAIEWLETTIDHELFTAVAPVLREHPEAMHRAPANAKDTLHSLLHDNDSWLATLAARAAGRTEPGESMDLIEKVFLLQQVDLLQGARTAHLGLLASIANEQDAARDTVLISKDEPAPAMYVVISGVVELRGGAGDHEITARDGAAFGTWALIDQAPSVVTARALEPTRLLRIDREDFYDLLNENPELAVGLLQGLARRIRALVA